jgi:hypothetical protein
VRVRFDGQGQRCCVCVQCVFAWVGEGMLKQGGGDGATRKHAQLLTTMELACDTGGVGKRGVLGISARAV